MSIFFCYDTEGDVIDPWYDTPIVDKGVRKLLPKYAVGL